MSLGLQDVHPLGLVATSDLPTLYASADAFVMPSTGEGFGIYLEAMACGTCAAGNRDGSVMHLMGVSVFWGSP